MIYHICPPDTKFIRPLLDRFELVKPDFNRCIIIVSRHHADHKTDINIDRIMYYGPIKKEIIKIIKTSDCDGIVVHALNDDILELSLDLARHFPVIWRSWGPDLHDILYPDLNLLLPYTQELIFGRNLSYQASMKLLRALYHQISGKVQKRKDRVLKKLEFLKSIDFIATTTRTEFMLLQKEIPGMKAKFIPLNYRSLDLKKLPELNSNKNVDAIMVGHSSHSYHNHTDIFYQLKNDSFDGAISVPLNYGDTGYRDKLINLGKKLFDGQIDFLTNFLRFDNYLDFIKSYSAFILNSKVQSGGGNIMYFLIQGSKVYLREENPIFQDYIENGVKLFSIQKDLSTQNLLYRDISFEDKVNNRIIVVNLFNSQSEKRNVINVYKCFNIAI